VYEKLLTEMFLPSIKSLSKHRTANFVVQRVVERSRESEDQFARLMNEFSAEIPKLMTISPGVVVALVKSASVHPQFQADIYKSLCDISGVLPHFAAGLLMFRVRSGEVGSLFR
jgi:NOP9-like PUF repeat domain